MYRELKRRSFIKTLSWRILATTTTTLIVWAFTNKPVLALSVGVVEIISKMILYFMHERAWDKCCFGKTKVSPAVFWFTGLSGSGKSTLADKANEYLQSKGILSERLDGDTVRDIFPKTGFSKEERNNHVKKVGFLASMLERNGVTVAASFISPYEEARDFVRSHCKNFIEIYVSTPIEECEKRDIKGLYAKARKGEIKNFTGLDNPFEKPQSPDLTIDTTGQSIEESFLKIKTLIDKNINQ